MGDFQEKRAALMEMSAEVDKRINRLGKWIRRLRETSAELIAAADGLMLKAADERDEEGTTSVRKIKHTKTERLSGAKANITEPSTVTKVVDLMGALKKGKRACSACRKPGHRKGSPVCEKTIEAYEEPRRSKKKKGRKRRAT